MKMRKAAALVTTVFIVMLSGCRNTQSDPYTEPVVINVYDTRSDFTGLQEGWYARLIQEKFNIQLNFLDTQDGMAIEKADLLVCDREKYNPGSLMEKGQLLNMESFLEEETAAVYGILDYRESFEAWNEPLAQGGIYILPTQLSRLSEDTPSEENLPLYGLFLNWEAYEEAKMPDIRDMDELLDVMEEMKKPEQQGITLCNDGDWDLVEHISRLCGTFGQEIKGFLVCKDKGRDYDELLSENSAYLQGLAWLREAYGRGLLDRRSFRLSYEEMEAAYENKDALLSIWAELPVEGYELAPVDKMEIVSHGCNPGGTTETYLAVSSHTKNPQRVVDFVGWLYSTEGIMYSGTTTGLKAAGPKELTWKMEDGNPVLTEFGKRVFVDQEDAQIPGEWGQGSWLFGSCHLSLQPVASVEVSPSGFTYNYTIWDTFTEQYAPSSDSWKEHMDAQDPVEYLMEHGQLSVIPAYVDIYREEPQQIVDKRSACREIIVDYSWKIICEKDDTRCRELLSEMRQKAEAKGYLDVLAYDQVRNGI